MTYNCPICQKQIKVNRRKNNCGDSLKVITCPHCKNRITRLGVIENEQTRS